METKARTQVLLVDDEPDVLRALGQLLRRRYQVHTAGSGIEGLSVIEREPAIAVVVSDMNMVGMNGAQFLAKVRIGAPEMVRILLTGQSNLDAAIAALNEGQIFRFLSKPCPPPMLYVAIEAAAEQHRLVSSERILLEETLRGTVRALADLLALASPLAFGRALRIKQLALQLASALGIKLKWQLELAAIFSQLGSIALPQQVLEKQHRGQPLSPEENALAIKSRALADQLILPIPRLEMVRDILAISARPPAPQDALEPAVDERTQAMHAAADVLRMAIELEAASAASPRDAMAGLAALRIHAERYDSTAFEAFLAARTATLQEPASEETASSLRPGMFLAEDAMTKSGELFAARGLEVSEALRERARNFAPELREPIRVRTRA